MKRKSIAIVLSITLLLSLTGCQEEQYLMGSGDGVKVVSEEEYQKYKSEADDLEEQKKIARDQEKLASLLTDILSSIAMSGEAIIGGEAELSELETITNMPTVTELQNLRGDKMPTITDLGFESQVVRYSDAQVYVQCDEVTGDVTVYVAEALGELPIHEKLIVSSN